MNKKCPKFPKIKPMTLPLADSGYDCNNSSIKIKKSKSCVCGYIPMKIFRWLNKLYARVFGYFWLPCPHCKEYFGGHEWTNLYQYIPKIELQDKNGFRVINSKGICNKCAIKLVAEQMSGGS